MKKLIRVSVVAEIEVDDKYYEGMTNDEIKNHEGGMWQEWIVDHVKSEKITVTDIESEVIDG